MSGAVLGTDVHTVTVPAPYADDGNIQREFFQPFCASASIQHGQAEHADERDDEYMDDVDDLASDGTEDADITDT